jgi:hypothetical protein
MLLQIRNDAIVQRPEGNFPRVDTAGIEGNRVPRGISLGIQVVVAGRCPSLGGGVVITYLVGWALTPYAGAVVQVLQLPMVQIIGEGGSHGSMAPMGVPIGTPGGEDTTLGVLQGCQEMAQDLLVDQPIVFALELPLGLGDVAQLDGNRQQRDQQHAPSGRGIAHRGGKAIDGHVDRPCPPITRKVGQVGSVRYEDERHDGVAYGPRGLCHREHGVPHHG